MAGEVQVSAPHPAAAWLAIAPIPRPDDPAAPGPMLVVNGQPFPLLMSGRPPGFGQVCSGVLLEIGPLPADTDPEVVAPYRAGVTVFYVEQNAIEVAGFHYLAIGSVICWQDAP